jgi:hypothetical protein
VRDVVATQHVGLPLGFNQAQIYAVFLCKNAGVNVQNATAVGIDSHYLPLEGLALQLPLGLTQQGIAHSK